MVRLGHIPAVVALLLLQSVAQAQGVGPPDEAAVIAAMPRLPFWMTWTVILFEREEILPGDWKCSILYRDSLNLGWFVLPLGPIRIQDVYFDRRSGEPGAGIPRAPVRK